MAGSSLDNEDGLISGINVTPLVDITLVLMIIFLVTASTIVKQDTGMQVSVPTASSTEGMPQGLVSLVLLQDGRLMFNGKALSGSKDSQQAEFKEGIAELRRKRLEQATNPTQIQESKKLNAFVTADQDVPYKTVAGLVDWLREEEITDIALDTKPPESHLASPANSEGTTTD
jgi:biopolymer transport protein ExbD